ncbi:hypothetical protein MTP99_009040 [Tenebrio molitor]|nr:hypothetical protein MTP99_009040 [Tenebrio molitor]
MLRNTNASTSRGWLYWAVNDMHIKARRARVWPPPDVVVFPELLTSHQENGTIQFRLLVGEGDFLGIFLSDRCTHAIQKNTMNPGEKEQIELFAVELFSVRRSGNGT